jgi:hypothetical protein
MVRGDEALSLSAEKAISTTLAGSSPNPLVNPPVRPVTALANCASAAPIRPAGYAQR